MNQALYRRTQIGSAVVSLPVKAVILLIVLAVGFSAYAPLPALAGPCDGTNSDNVIVCSDDGNSANLKKGDDDFTQNEGGEIDDNVSGDGISGIFVYGQGGDDNIIINGYVGDNVLGDDIHTLLGGSGGDDNILISLTGVVDEDVRGDDIAGLLTLGGDDTITVLGVVGGNVYGDYLGGLGAVGGSDTITIAGTVVGNVVGDGLLALGGLGGNDVINISGTVYGDVLADGLVALGDIGGDDLVIIHSGASIAGDIDGGGGYDTLAFTFIPGNLLAGLDPSGGSITYGGETYTWANFEELLGVLIEVAGRAGLRVFMVMEGLAVVEDEEGEGFNLFVANGKLFMPFEILSTLTVDGPPVVITNPKVPGWSLEVLNLGVDPNNADYHVYQVTVYQAGVALGSFLFSYW